MSELFNVAPRSATRDIQDSVFADTKLFADDSRGYACASQASNLSDGLFCETRSVVTFSLPVAIASFLCTISIIVCNRPGEEMGWIATCRVVASVTDDCSVRDRANGKMIGKTMGDLLGEVATVYPSISVTITEASPFPALVRIANIDSRPELVINRLPLPACVVAMNERERIPLLNPPGMEAPFGNQRLFTAAALAKPVGYR